MCSPIAYFTQHMASFWRVTQRTLLQNQVQLFVAKTLKFILAIEIVLYEALTFKLQPTDSWVEHFSITYAEKLLLFQAVSCCGHHTGLVIRGTWAKIPLGAITVFSHKLSSVELPLTFYQFLLNLDCESICDPPGGDSVVGSRDRLHCLLTFNYPCPPVNHMLIQRYHIEKLAH